MSHANLEGFDAMIKAPIPPNESERLTALRALKILDTPPEERFDRITRLASRLFDMPIAYVALVDADRQWFKSSCGLSASETPRDISFCGHTILRDEMLLIPDTLRDPRFADNPFVTGDPRIRFYAGVPLKVQGGHKVGTICIADHQPRKIDDRDQNHLRDMATIIEHELEMVDVIQLQDQLIQNQAHLARELADASAYVRSLLPQPLTGPVQTQWKFVPCSTLGGDAFGYHWVDKDHFAMYLLDVSGHGVGSALLSVSAMQTLRTQTLPATNFRDPSQVLSALNNVFQMEDNNDLYFSIWYGIYDRVNRHIRYAAGGHPPALLLTGPNEQHAHSMQLGMNNYLIGILSDAMFASQTVNLETYSKLYIFSDGTYEIPLPDGNMMKYQQLVDQLILSAKPDVSAVDRVLKYVQQTAARENLPDDFSLLEVVLT